MSPESITRLLLEHGASPEARNRYKYTPMMLVSDGRIATLITKAIEMLQEKANDGFIEVSKVTETTYTVTPAVVRVRVHG